MGKVGRRAFAGLIAAVGLCAALGAQAQAWPAKPVKFVVGAAAGGSASDAATRFFADRIREATGQAMLVENKPGADGNVAAEIVVRSPADGYTALVTGNNTHAANIHLYKALNYDPYKDFAPVTTYARVPYILLANPDKIPARTLKDFIAFAKANPGKLNYGSGGSGTNTHLGSELLKAATGIDMVHVPYKGAGAVLQDLMAGQVQALVASLPTILQHVKSGKLRALMVLADQRTSHLPDVPAAKEAGFPSLVMTFWVNFAAPAGTPRPVIDRMNHEVVAALQKPAMKARLNDLGLDAVGGTPEQATRLVESEIQRWSAIIKAANIKAD